MIQELVYTSAPRGLKAGARGFCTVGATPGMGVNLASRLEMLSGYKHVFPPGDDRAAANPINYSHLVIREGGETHHVLSRVADAGLDYSNRSNKLAWHLVLDRADLPLAGPAAVLAAAGVLDAQWEGEPRILQPRRGWPTVADPTGPSRHWLKAAGDAGWAGALIERWRLDARAPSYAIYPAGMDVLSLVVECLSLLPPRERWQVTFSTYFTKLPPNVSCAWRFLVDGTDEAAAARRLRGPLVIDLTTPLGAAPDSEWAEAARTGLRRAATSMPLATKEPTAAPKPSKVEPVARDNSREYSVAPLADEDEFGELVPTAPPIAPLQNRRSRRTALLVAAALVLVLGGLGGWGLVRAFVQGDSEPNGSAHLNSATPMRDQGSQPKARSVDGAELKKPSVVVEQDREIKQQEDESTTDRSGHDAEGATAKVAPTSLPTIAEDDPKATEREGGDARAQPRVASGVVAIASIDLPNTRTTIDSTKDPFNVTLVDPAASLLNKAGTKIEPADAAFWTKHRLLGEFDGDWLLVARQPGAGAFPGTRNTHLMKVRISNDSIVIQYLDRTIDPILRLLVLRAVREQEVVGLLQLTKETVFESSHLTGNGRRLELLREDQLPLESELLLECRIGDLAMRQPLAENKPMVVRSDAIAVPDPAALTKVAPGHEKSLHYPTRVDAIVTPTYSDGELRAEMAYAIAMPPRDVVRPSHDALDSAISEARQHVSAQAASIANDIVADKIQNKLTAEDDRSEQVKLHKTAIEHQLHLDSIDAAVEPFKVQPEFRILRVIDGVDVVFARSRSIHDPPLAR